MPIDPCMLKSESTSSRTVTLRDAAASSLPASSVPNSSSPKMYVWRWIRSFAESTSAKSDSRA